MLVLLFIVWSVLLKRCELSETEILMGRTFLGRLRLVTVSLSFYDLKLNTDYAKLLRNFNRIFPKINKSINNRFRKNLQKS